MSRGLKIKGLGGNEGAAGAAEPPKREKKDIIRELREAEAAGNMGAVGRLQAELGTGAPAKPAAAAPPPPEKPAAAAAAAPPPPATPAAQPKGTLKKYSDGKIYRMVEILSPEGSITGFEMFDPATGELKARASAKGGKPANPVTFL